LLQKYRLKRREIAKAKVSFGWVEALRNVGGKEGKAGGGGRERKRGRKKGGCIKTFFQKEGLNRKKRLYPSTNPTPLKKRDKLKCIGLGVKTTNSSGPSFPSLYAGRVSQSISGLGSAWPSWPSCG